LIRATALFTLALLLFNTAFAVGNDTDVSGIATTIRDSIEQNVIGANEYGYILLGIMVLGIIVLMIFAARLSLIGFAVFLPVSIIALVNLGYLPAYLSALILIAVGAGWGVTMLKLMSR